MGGCINKHGGLKTSCLACKIYEPCVWRAMTAPFIQHQLAAPQRKLGPERFSLIFGRAPAPEICASAIQLKTHLPPDEAGDRSGFFLILNAAHWSALLLDLRPRRQLYRHIPLGESKCPDSTIRPSIGEQAVAPEEHLEVHLCSQISICDWNPAVNKPSGPSSALRLQLGLQNLLSYLALLNSAWTIIPGELSERAKEFSLYI